MATPQKIALGPRATIKDNTVEVFVKLFIVGEVVWLLSCFFVHSDSSKSKTSLSILLKRGLRLMTLTG